MADLTPRDDNKKAVSEILKRVDQLIKNKSIDQAALELSRAKELDPKNIYVFAYEERLTGLTEELKKSKLLEEQKKREEEENQKKQEEQRVKARAEEEQRKREQIERQAEEDRRLKLEEDSRRRENEELKKAQERTKQEEAKSKEKSKEKSKLDEKTGRKIEERVFARLRQELGKPRIVLIDDDAKLLQLFKETLEDGGYIAEAFATSDEAYKHVREHVPDLILCDINLETSTMGGFTFFEKVREMDELAEVPFIFLTGLTDEVLVRTGKELGVDDYLTKPISEKALLATIKGKIKRFQQLKKGKKDP